MLRSSMAVVAIAAASLSASTAAASSFELKPALAVSEEYNDNIYGTADGRRTDFITRVQPGARLSGQSPLLNLDAVYIFDYRNYAKGNHGNEQIHNADLKGTLQILDNFFFVDLGDALHRTTTDVARDIATESLLVRQVSQNIASVSPYLLWRPSAKTTLKTGYRYTDTRYFEGDGIDKREHLGFANLEHQVSDKLVLSAGYAYTSAEASPEHYDRNDVSAGFRYSFKPRSSIFGSVGNSWNSFSKGGDTSDLFWDAGVSHDFGIAVALLETKVQNVEDPLTASTRQVSYQARIDRAFERGAIGASALYLENFVARTGNYESRRGTVSGNGRYDITPKLSVSGSVYAERFGNVSGTSSSLFAERLGLSTADQYPYRLTASASLSYGFYNDQTFVTAAYTFVTDRLEWDSASGEKLTDRVLIELRSAF